VRLLPVSVKCPMTVCGLGRRPYQRLMRVRYARKGRPRTLGGRTFRWRYDYSQFDNFEPPVYEAFVAQLTSGATVLDIGAWIGLYTVTAAAAGCRVYAFEPSPETRDLLQLHLRLNRVQATIIPKAMSDREGRVVFYAQHASGWASMSRAAASRVELVTGDAKHDAITVPTVTLDGFCKEHGLRPDILKVDVEGAEARVLAGATRFLRDREGCMLIEAHPVALEDFCDSLPAMLRLLHEEGWDAECIFRRGDDRNPDRTLHYFVQPRRTE
jgi:FkbM family methyltransferase